MPRVPPCIPMTTSRPFVASSRLVRLQVLRAHAVQHDVDAVGRHRADLRGPVVAVGEGVRRRRSSGSTRSFSGLPAVATTVAPSCRAYWMANEPMPPAPPCTRNTSPAASWASSRLDTTVAATSSTPAASTTPQPRRRRHHLPGGDRDLLRVPAARQQGDARVADGPARHPVADGGDVPRDLQPDQRARPGRRRVVALPLQEVGAVDPGRRHVDQELARPGLRSSTSASSSTSGPPASRATIAFTARACHTAVGYAARVPRPERPGRAGRGRIVD